MLLSDQQNHLMTQHDDDLKDLSLTFADWCDYEWNYMRCSQIVPNVFNQAILLFNSQPYFNSQPHSDLVRHWCAGYAAFAISDSFQMPICRWMQLMHNVNLQSTIIIFNKISFLDHSLNQVLSSILFRFLMATSIINHRQISNKRSLSTTLWLHNILKNFNFILVKILDDV